MKVKFLPQDLEFDIKPGQSVMHVAQDHNIYIKSVCKGVPSCAECRVRILDGEHNVLPPGSEELSLIGTGHFIDRRRLSCQLKCFGDITVDMTEQIKKQNEPLSGNKARKTAIKDDRIEDTHTRTRSSVEEDGSTEDALVSAPSIEGGPSSARAVHAAEAAPGNASNGSGSPRGPRRERSGEPRRGPPAGSPGGGGPRAKSAGGERRPQAVGPASEAKQNRPQGERTGPRPVVGGGPKPAPVKADGAPKPAVPGEEGGNAGGPKRRRRRGRGGRPPQQ